MDWSKAFNILLGGVLRHTLMALAFGVALEWALSLAGGQAFRVQVPVLITFTIFTLSLSGVIVAMYFYWLMLRYK